MTILVVGLNHKTAPLHVRDLVAVSSGGLEDALGELRGHVDSGVILSTCNRSELYALVPSLAAGTHALLGYMCDYHGVDRRELAPYVYVYQQEEAVRHLFRVACGLDSMILGETQILGQVRNAFGVASRGGQTQGALTRLFQQALRVGKRARGETGISRNPLSISRAAVELTRRVFPEITGRRVLVLGIGDAGKLATRALADAGTPEIVVANRTYDRAVEIAAQLGGTPLPSEEVGTALGCADIVICSTGSPGYLLTPEMITRARDGSHRSLVIVDIAVPRDVDPAVKGLPTVSLYDIDDLEAVSETNRRERAREARKVEAIVDGEVARFMDWLNSRETVPTVAALREHAEAIRSRELARLLRRLPTLSDDDMKPLEAFSRALVNKLLHGPFTSLKVKRDAAHTQAVRELFDLDGDGS